MRDLLLSLFIFTLSIGFHILWCRFRKKTTLQMYSFGVIATAGLIIYIFITLRIFQRLDYAFDQGIWHVSLWVSSVLLYVLLMPTYIIIYFNTIVQSPSKTILILVRKHGMLSFDELARLMTDDEFIMTRMKDLLDFGYATKEGSLYSLTPRGVILAKVLAFYEKLFGRPMGG